MRRCNFLVTYGDLAATMTCVACRKTTEVVGAPVEEPTGEDMATYRSIHVCGPKGDGRDVAPVTTIERESGG